ncbi:MAG: gamma tubulin interacting protein [Monoraphidium minutum]|nr:MAG: gamma tubulin interacting protein [Monoraphidium minutum]
MAGLLASAALKPPDVLSGRDSAPYGDQGDELFSYRNLLQELLMALLGYTGDVFVDAADAAAAPGRAPQLQHPALCTVKLSGDLPWVEARDRQLIDRVAALGFHYKQLRAFVAQERGATPRSAYRQALCAGITEFLGVYQDAVLGLQQQLLACPNAGLATLQYQLLPMQQLLPQLHQLVWELRRSADGAAGAGDEGPTSSADADGSGSAARDSPGRAGSEGPAGGGLLRGAELLRTLQRHALNGQPALQAVFQRLQWHCHQVLFQQLAAWMVHGLLVDEGGEFFVQGAYALPDARPDGAPWSREDVSYHEWHAAFGVNVEALPPGVSAPLASSIEFVGKAVRLLRSPAGTEEGQVLLPFEDQMAWAAALGALQREQRYSEGALERAVEVMRADVAARLWHLLVVRAGLVGHLVGLKDYLLLARGDFWAVFLGEASRLMAAPPRPGTAAADVSAPFQAAAAKSSAAADPLFRLFALHYSDRPLRVQAAAGAHTYIEVPAFDPAWDNLWLEARLPWPLGLLLTPRHLDRYNALFQLLLRLKRVQLHLEQAWQDIGHIVGRGGGGVAGGGGRRGGSGGGGGGGGADVVPLLQLRQHMAHLVTNLQIYLQVDVIESNFSALERRVAAAQDFSEAERAHDAFLHALVTQSFLGHASLCRQFGEVFGQARRLCGVVARARAGEGVDWRQVQAISDAFSGVVSTLFVSLQSRSLQQYDKAPHLRQLYLRLDFNGYIGRRRMSFLRAAQQAGAAAGAGAGSGGGAAQRSAGGGGEAGGVAAAAGAAAAQQPWRRADMQ